MGDLEIVNSIFAENIFEKIKTKLNDQKFIKELVDRCKSIDNYLREDDIRSLLCDDKLVVIIKGAVEKNGFDFKEEFRNGIFDLAEQYELTPKLANTCFNILQQVVENYLKKEKPDFIANALIDDTHTVTGNLEKKVSEMNNNLCEMNKNIHNQRNIYKSILEAQDKDEENHYRVFEDSFYIYDVFVDNCTKYMIINNDNWGSVNTINDHEENEECSLSDILKYCMDNRLVCIEGGFGVGKTALSLMLQKKLSEKKKATIFVEATKLYNIFGVYENISNWDFNISSELYLFIESVDNIVTLNDSDNNEKKITGFAEKIVKLIKENNNLHVIINTRPFYIIKPDDTGFDERTPSISELFASVFVPDFMADLYIIFPNGFKPKKGGGSNNTRIDAYFDSLGNAYESSTKLTKKKVKEIHPDVPNSCQIPIFTYAFGTHFYKECKGDINAVEKDPFVIYTDFIKKTIKGKYVRDSHRVDLSFDDFYELLQIIAVEVLDYSKKNLEIREEKQEQDKTFDVHDTFALSFDLFDKKTKGFVEERLRRNGNRASYYVLNYYFFSLFPIDNGYCVKFSDNNVLYCLAASYYNNKLKFLKELDMDVNVAFSKARNDLEKFGFQYHVVDYILNTMAKREDKTAIIANNALRLLHYAQNTLPKDFVTIKMMILLSIIFLKLNKSPYTSYGDCNSEHFFKEFDWLFKAYKALDNTSKHEKNQHRYLIERYYMKSQIYGAKFKRINLKHYNFQEARLSDVSFFQCKISNTVYNSAMLKNVNFELCQFINYVEPEKNLNEELYKPISAISKKNAIFLKGAEVSGSLDFSDCTFKNVLVNGLLSAKEGVLVFENCRIEETDFGELSNVTIKFLNCIMNNVAFNDCTNCTIKFDDMCNIRTDVDTKLYGEDNELGDKVWYRKCQFINPDTKYMLDIDKIQKH